MNTSPDKNFTIAVIATMSAGKSTLLNAMVGDNLLPAKNEACTSTIFRIEDHDELKDFRASYIDGKIQSDWQDVNRETLAGWNDRNYREIEIQGNLPYIKNVDSSYRVVFFDTPGPNNSTESNHEKITKRIIKRADFCYLICVLNASVMGVQDEWKLLSFVEKEIKKSSAKLCPLFVVNKIDLLDIEKGENPKILIEKTISYLSDLGYTAPIVIPVCSSLSLEIRKTMRTAVRMTAREVAGDYKGAAKLKSLFSRRYKAITLPRAQEKLKTMLHCFGDMEKNYFEALSVSPSVRSVLKKLADIPRQTPRRKIKIAGEYFSFADLYRADILTGISPLEYILEQKLQSFAKGKKE